MNLPNYQEARMRTKEKVQKQLFTLDDKYKDLGKDKKYFIKTYGCQMNEHDSENIVALLEEMGFTKTKDLSKADIAFLNTCAIRENAHDKVFGYVGRIKHLKEDKKLITVFCGCMAQEESVVNEVIKKHKEIDIVFGTHNINMLPKYIYNFMNDGKGTVEVLCKSNNIFENMPVKRDNQYKAWVNIIYGCDKFCTYCIVPYTRGKEKSRDKEDILNEVKTLVKQGYIEVTLLGQNVNAYGKDLNNNYTMKDLLQDVSKTGIKRIRFVTSHPWDFTDEMIEVISTYPNIMPYIHLPIQSGSNKILKLMGRRYTKEVYVELFEKIKKRIPNVSITTDIIVGFPGETKEDFEETIKVVEQCQFDGAYTFIFSPREGTPAMKMEDFVSQTEKQERLYKLNELVNKLANMNNQKYLDKEVLVLIEGESKKENMLFGYTDTMKLVNIKGSKEYIGKIVKVKITSIRTWCLYGEII